MTVAFLMLKALKGNLQSQSQFKKRQKKKEISEQRNNGTAGFLDLAAESRSFVQFGDSGTQARPGAG